ncbi:MAG TPA: hypothetical protein VGG05_28955 [Pseudonocardiaceae bacterium]
MTQVLAGRLQTRLFVVATVGVLWTVMLTPLLPVPPGTGIGTTYHMTFENLGLMAGLGLLWELVYHLLQQIRWDKDWPTLLGLLTVVNEAIALWFLDHWLHLLPGTVGLAAPLLPAFAIHIVTAWLVMWLFLQGPIRVLHFRWRFEGGRVLRRAPGRRHRTDVWLETQWLESLRSPDQPHQLAVMAGGPGDVVELPRSEPRTDQLVTGALCPSGHFGNADVLYCMTCGAAVPPQPPVLGTRPPVGVLITTDGTTRVLDRDLSVIVTDDALEFRSDGESTGSGLADIRIVGWQPVVSSSAGPVAVLLPNGTRIGAAVNVPVPLVPGSALVAGEHVVRYDSPYATDVVPTEPREPVATRIIVPAGRRTSPAARRVAAAAAIVVLAGAVAFAIVDGSRNGERRAGVSPPTLIPPPPLSSFSVPPWTLPSQTQGATSPLFPVSPTGRLSIPPLPLPNPTLGPLPPTGVAPVTLPAPPTSPGGGTTTQPVPTSPPRPPSSPAPVSPVPTTTLCVVDVVGLAQCAMGLLGGG